MKRVVSFFGLTIMACGLWTSVVRADVLAEYTYDPGGTFNPQTQGWTLGDDTAEDVNFFNSGGVSLLSIKFEQSPSILFSHTVPTNVFFDAWSFTGKNRFAGNSQEEFGQFMFVDDGTNLWHMSFYNHGVDAADGIYIGGDPEGPALGITATKVWEETVGAGPGGTTANKPMDGFLEWSLVDSDGAGGAPPKLQLEGEDLVLLTPVVAAPSMFPAGTVGWGSINVFEVGYFQTQHMVFDGNPNAEPPVGVTGDYNNNGTVDAADYVLWRDGGPLQNDPTSGVQPEDYNVWRANFGNIVLGSGTGLQSRVVPEPSSQLLVVLGGMLVAVAKGATPRRRRA